MSMCMYIARGPEAQLRELAEDAETLCDLGMAAFGGGGLAGSPFANLAASLGNTDEKVARIEQVLGQQPQLRQAVGDLVSKVNAQRAAPGGGQTVAIGDVRSLLSALGAAGALSGGGRGGAGAGAGLGAALGAAFGGRGCAGAVPPQASARRAPGGPPVVDLHKS